MAKSMKLTPGWLPEPEEHDYPAAASYLSLHFDQSKVDQTIDRLRKAAMTSFKAKDIFRASGLSLLGVSNSHVAGNLKKVKRGEPLSPLLLVRRADGKELIIADGYHRLCAMYALDEDLDVPCKIV
jgi:hypothetical protein